MKKNLKIITLALVSTAVAVFATWGLASANTEFKGRFAPDSEKMEEMRANMDEMRANMDEINAAIEAGDYETWSQLAGDCPMKEYINEENFSLFQEMHAHRQAAKEIAEELGIPEHGFGGHMNKGRGMGHKMNQSQPDQE